MAPRFTGFGEKVQDLPRPPIVIPAFIAGTHLSAISRAERWVAGINPAMTKEDDRREEGGEALPRIGYLPQTQRTFRRIAYNADKNKVLQALTHTIHFLTQFGTATMVRSILRGENRCFFAGNFEWDHDGPGPAQKPRQEDRQNP